MARFHPSFVATTSISDLAWRRRRFFIAVLGTALVFALTLLLSGFLEHFTLEVDRSLRAMGNDGFVIRKGTPGPFTSLAPFDDGITDTLRATPGVAAADPVATVRQTLPGETPLEIFVVGHRVGGLGAPPDVEGRPVADQGEMVIDSSSGLDVGDRLSLGGFDFVVTGTVSDLSVGGGLPNAYITLDDAQQLVFRGLPLATSILVKGRPQTLPAEYEYSTVSEAKQDLMRPLADVIDSIKTFRLLLWIVAAAIVGSVLYLSALERTGDFAVFKATGTSTGDLAGTLALQAALLSLTASIVAIGLAFLLAPQFPAGVSFPVRLLLLLPVVAVFVGLLGSVAGLRRAVSVDPALAFGGR